jgi:hypothetical protein
MRRENAMKNLLIFCIALFMSANVFALDLQQAKSQGLVGETNKGYIAVVTSSASSDVKKLVSQVNSQRKSRYKKIAVSHGLSEVEVGKLAAKKALEKTQRGHYYQTPSGKWNKK